MLALNFKTSVSGQIFLFCLFPAIALADVHKCKNQDGTITYSDRPCQGAPRTSATPLDPAVTPTKQQQKFTGDDRVDRLMNDPNFIARGDRCNKGDIKACNEIFDNVNEMANDECSSSGDKMACSWAYCSKTTSGKATGSEFIACAKTSEFPYGSFWAIQDGKPEFNKKPHPDLLKLMNGSVRNNRLTLLCFRKRASITTMQSSFLFINEVQRYYDGANGPAVEYTFNVDVGKGGNTVMSQNYRSIEELAAVHCEN